MKKEEFVRRCKETRDAFLSDNEIEKAVETLYYVGAIEENEIDNHYLNVYSMMALLFQKAADYSLNGSCSESTTRNQRKTAKNYSRFIGGRVAGRK